MQDSVCLLHRDQLARVKTTKRSIRRHSRKKERTGFKKKEKPWWDVGAASTSRVHQAVIPGGSLLTSVSPTFTVIATPFRRRVPGNSYREY